MEENPYFGLGHGFCWVELGGASLWKDYVSPIVSHEGVRVYLCLCYHLCSAGWFARHQVVWEGNEDVESGSSGK